MAGKELEDACRPFLSDSLREVLDAHLAKKSPIIAFPKPGKICSAYVSRGYDIFGGEYAKKLGSHLDGSIGSLWRIRNKHRGNFIRKKKEVRNSLLFFIIMCVLLIYDLPYRLIMQPVQSLYLKLMPMLPWGEKSVAHLLLPNLASMIVWGIIAGILIYRGACKMERSIDIPVLGWRDNNLKTVVQLTIMAQPFWVVMRFGMGMPFLDAVKEFTAAMAAEAGNSLFMRIVSALEAIASKGQLLTAMFLIIYAVAFLQLFFDYLSRCKRQKKALEYEEKLTLEDIKDQWKKYTEYSRADLKKADRQLKFLDIWYHAVYTSSGKNHFPGWFDINTYVEKMEKALFPENRLKIQQLEEDLRKEREEEKHRREEIQIEQEKRKKEQKAAAVVDNRSDEQKEADKQAALDRIGHCWGADGKIVDQKEAFQVLKNALGYLEVVPAKPYPANARGAKLYEDGFKGECNGRNYRVIMDYYEKAAKMGHLLALARLANIYDTDYELTDSTGHNHPMTLEQWVHSMEQAAVDARMTMGLTPEAPMETLLSHAWNPATGFDNEVLYYLAMHCKEETDVSKSARQFVYRFVIDVLGRDPDARTSWYLAQINYYCCDNMTAARLWAEAAAGKAYPPALYFLYEHQEKLGIPYKLAQAYCYKAWDDGHGYPPARISEIWDKLNERSRREMEKNIERLRRETLRQAKEEQIKIQLEAYRKSLEEKERMVNVAIHGTPLSDDEAVAAGKMSVKEHVIGSIAKEEKLDKRKKELESRSDL